ncbi:MAG: DUF3619 family protein [Betaproteobacteria bacterium]|nr:DUF3619 family protein [Betaproteobacteria bacterium]
MNPPSHRMPAAEDRLGTLLAARLDEGLLSMGPDISERLRFARERAVARARQARLQAATGPVLTSWQAGGLSLAGSGAGAGGGWGVWSSRAASPRGTGSWWTKLVSVLPLLVLALGFLAIQDTLMERQIQAAAEVDAALLTDDLPPQAYSDPGFAEFLRRVER